MAKKQVGVVLAGCGFLDGAEIYESVLTLLAIDRAGAQAVCMAPNVPQMHVVNHLKKEPAASESRNVLTEAARLARGQIKDIATVRAVELDALIFPGGFGAAKNLCTYATQGAQFQVNPEVERLIREVHEAGKPLGFLCIAPMIAAKVLGRKQVKITIGNDPATAKDVEAQGAAHVPCEATDVCIDKALKVVTTPAYMVAKGIAEAAQGIEKCVAEVLRMA